MKSKIDTETLIGGAAAIISLLAILVEVAFGGFSSEAITSGIKDFSSTIVAVIVLVVAVRKLKPKKTTETYDTVLKEELEKWVEHSMPLIHKADDHPDGITRYYMLTDLDKILYTDDEKIENIIEKAKHNSGTFNGKFVDLPNKNVQSIKFYLNASTFKDRAKAKNENYTDTLEKLAPAIANSISKNFSEFCKASPGKDGKTIYVKFEHELNTPNNARDLVKLIQYVMTLYTIIA